MRSITIKEAKAKLNELIEAAERGEEVVLMRGSHHVAALVPITDADLQLAPRITDAQSDALWEQVHAERAAGKTRIFESAEDVIAHLQKKPVGPRRVAPKPRAKRVAVRR